MLAVYICLSLTTESKYELSTNDLALIEPTTFRLWIWTAERLASIIDEVLAVNKNPQEQRRRNSYRQP